MTGRVAADFVALENGTKDFEHVLDMLRKTLAGLDQDLRASLDRWKGRRRELTGPLTIAGRRQRMIWPNGWGRCTRPYSPRIETIAVRWTQT